MQKVAISIIGALTTASIIAAASAYVKVQILEVKVQSNKEILTEIKADVKNILKAVNGEKFCCKIRK